MPMRDPMKAAKKWADRLSASGQEMIDGVMSLTEAPSAQAIQHEETMRQRLLAALSSGKWRENLAQVTLQMYQEAMRTKGVPRATEGARMGQGKMEQFMREFLPFARQVSQEIRAMPNVTDADREARALANIRRMREFRRTRR